MHRNFGRKDLQYCILSLIGQVWHKLFAWNAPFPSKGSGRLMRTNSISVNCRFAARRSHSLRKIGIGAVAGKDMPEYMLTILDDILETGKLTW